MALRSGLAAQFGFAAETTWGTYQTPDHFTEFVSETMKLNRTRTLAKGIRPGKTVARSQRFRTTEIDATGTVNLEVASNAFGLLFKHALGTSTISADGAGYKHALTLGDPFGLGLTVQIGTPDITGTVRARSYTGCKITQLDLSTKVNEPLDLQLTLDSNGESTTQALASPSYASNTVNEIFFVDECSLTIAGSSFNVYDFDLTIKNNEKVDRFYVGSTTKSEPILNAYRDITGTLTSDLNNLTVYNYFVTDNTATGSIVLTCTGQKSYDTGKVNRCIITLPVVRYDGDTPNVAGMDLVQEKIPFTIMDDDAQVPIEIDYYSSDALD